MKKYTYAMIRGGLSGVICALIINTWIILLFYTHYNFNTAVFFLMGQPAGISVFLLMKQRRIKSFLIAWCISLLLFAVTDLTIGGLGIVDIFYHKAVGDEMRMTAGDEFAIMGIYMYNYFWIIIGTITAFIITAVNQKRTDKNKQ